MLADPSVGWAGALLFNEQTGRLIDGHARRNVVDPRSLVPVLVGSWTEQAERKILLSLDPISSMAQADAAVLRALIEEVDLSGHDIELAGLVAALEGMVDHALTIEAAALELQQGLTDPDAIPEPPDEPITKRGDLWILGEHRLLCGDSASATDVDRLLDGQPIHLVNTDPPYNVKVEPRSNNAIAAGNSSFPEAKKKRTHHQSFDVARQGEKKRTTKKMRAKDRPLANDFMTDEAFDEMLDAWFGNMARVLIPGGGFYIWGGYANLGNYPGPLKRAGLYFSQGIVWDKQHPVLTRKDYMGAFEIAFYGWREGAAHRFFGPNNATDLWHVKKVNPASMVHLTEKPVELAVRALQYSSHAGENVLDLFGGSGSSLIAAEQTQRRAFLMELDPAYCDVIVQRYEQFTGKKAERA
ncbi:MAG: site-specific DNA-methyltransferase [Phycisphaerales bacterium]|nr:site-specific DNA-methyltransferase [Phycisphaerales bacterium]